MSEKLFKVAGIATDRKNCTKVRYANDLETRTKVLVAAKFTNVHLVNLNDEFDKSEACQLLKTMQEFNNYHDIIDNELARLSRIDDDYSVKMYKKQRKLAVANITVSDILNAIK